MAQTKRPSQAQKAVSEKKRKNTNNTTNNSKRKTDTKESVRIPVRLISSTVCIGLFILFLVMIFAPDGALTQFLYRFMLGIIGKAALYVLIPALLYLFIIHAFSSGRPIKMRTTCLLSAVVCIGCIFHLGTDFSALPKGLFQYIGALYSGGVAGQSGGVLCGLVTWAVKTLCGSVISYILFTVAAILTLLASMQITIPSLIRAFENRPRASWESGAQPQERPEPASIVVNHLANKRIERMEDRRRAKEEKSEY